MILSKNITKPLNQNRMETGVEMLVRELTDMGIEISEEIIKRAKFREQMLLDLEWQLGYGEKENS